MITDSTNIMSLSSPPAVLGLHSNAEIAKNFVETKNILECLIKLQPIPDSDSEISRYEIIDRIAKETLEKLPPCFNIQKIKSSFAMNSTPTSIVLIQELNSYNKLIEVVNDYLNLLRRSIAGKTIMDASLEKLANSIFRQEVPVEWKKFAPDTCKNLPRWIDHLIQRAYQYKYWSSSGEPLVMWLSGLHAPESFLTALIQVEIFGPFFHFPNLQISF